MSMICLARRRGTGVGPRMITMLSTALWVSRVPCLAIDQHTPQDRFALWRRKRRQYRFHRSLQ